MLTGLLLLTALALQQEGGAVLLDAARALQTDREILDTVTIETVALGSEVRVEANLVLAAEGSGKVTRGNVTAVINDDWASVTHAAKKDIYFVAEADGPSIGLLMGLANSPASLLPHFALRLAEDEEMAVAAFQTSWEDEVTLESCEEVHSSGPDGPALLEIVLKHLDGEERILIDPHSRLIRKRTATRGDQKMTITHQLRLGDAIASPLAFDAGERKLAPELLSVLTAAAGDRAPPFLAPNLAGETQSLDDALADSVVVLDFWATWCRPCRKGLKELQQYAATLDPDKPGVQIFAVNVSEKMEWEPRIEKVQSFWQEAGYSFPVLLDPDDSIRQAYGAAEIPLTVVIGRDGIVRDSHQDGELIDWLKKTVNSAKK
ncbi:MAG: TlpA disulfide reductase family protein [Planctomycetota bacterium]